MIDLSNGLRWVFGAYLVLGLVEDGLIDVEAVDVESGFLEVEGHRQTHVSESEEGNCLWRVTNTNKCLRLYRTMREADMDFNELIYPSKGEKSLFCLFIMFFKEDE